MCDGCRNCSGCENKNKGGFPPLIKSIVRFLFLIFVFFIFFAPNQLFWILEKIFIVKHFLTNIFG